MKDEDYWVLFNKRAPQMNENFKDFVVDLKSLLNKSFINIPKHLFESLIKSKICSYLPDDIIKPIKLMGDMPLDELCTRVGEIFVAFVPNEKNAIVYAAKANDTSNTKRSSQNKFCVYCKRGNHTVEDCYILKTKMRERDKSHDHTNANNRGILQQVI